MRRLSTLGRPATLRRACGLAGLVLALIGVFFAGPASAPAQAPNVDWPGALPPLPTIRNPQPGPQAGCPRPVMGCLDYEIQRMQEAQQRFGCDHRGVFATTYLTLTEILRDTLRRDPHFFADRDYLIYEDALFANYYFHTLDDYAAGRPVPQAWQIAFQTAASGDANAAQDMLLGINAHVQRDMPYVMATLGLHTPNGGSRKADHGRMNEVLNQAYEPVVRAVADRYDAMVNFTNPGTPADNLAGLELVKVWREDVWRNAERLLNATTPDQRAQVEASIEANAATTARMISAIQIPPGYRSVRDAYCQAHLPHPAAPAPAASRPTAPPRPSIGSRRSSHRHRHRLHHRRARVRRSRRRAAS